MLKKISIAFIAILIAPAAVAEQYWSNTSFSLLNGSNYEVGDNEKSVFTLEHASGHSWGSTFLFFDRLRNSNNGGHETYGEVGFDFTLAKLEKDGYIKDVFLATQVEMGVNDGGLNGFDNYLYGIGVNLNVPGAKFFKATLFQRNNEAKDDNNQITLVWAFPIAGGTFVYDGFLDRASAIGNGATSLNFTSQLKWDMGKAALNMKPGKLFFGIEYVYWNNKFGIPDSSVFNTDERNINLLLKWHL